MELTRREFLQYTAVTAAGAMLAGVPFLKGAEAAAKEEKTMEFVENLEVPYSTGRSVPTIAMPENACDCAHHIYDPVRFPYKPSDTRNQPPAGVDVYRLLQKKLGMTRSVVIQPSAYGTDNRCLIDALEQLGENSRGVAVVEDSVTDEELERLHHAGVRGLRYNVSRGATLEAGKVLRMGERIKGFGNWHLDFWVPADIVIGYREMFEKLAVPCVFDHRGHLPQAQGIRHPAFSMITDLMKEGKAWVKLSALYHDSNLEHDYADTVAIGKAYVEAAPERVLWGTDWPHPSEFSAKRDFPDDAHLLDLLAIQAPDEKVRHQILVENPEALFGFNR